MTIELPADVSGRLPDDVTGRLQSARLSEGTATLVLDVSGLEGLARDKLEVAARDALRGAPGVREVRVAMTADRVTRKLVAVASGKGGVGKSTVATNLAVALSRAGSRVGLVDADIYGPSQPRLLGNEGQKPEARDKQLVPVPSEWGIPLLSMGHLVDPGQAIAWRGPMAGSALAQLVDAEWGDAELLVVDMPPGTGDVQLTMMQRFKPAGAVIVSTPQDLALMDAARAVSLFDQGGIPIVGLVENMAGYVCPHCGNVSDPFGSGGAEAAAREMGMPFLGRIPLDTTIRQESDAGRPVAAGEGPQAQAFARIAGRIAGWLEGSGEAKT
ncbi:iron-sulfur cluster carrier protein [Novosphingobium marinum]|uniref:Iron-sulfur cluster carrier protein n=1 Tax=Novosphingobium marinum TaxID=1514948 RepID=A0A7Y9XV87_9SPHN|nr:Mrp/NBP35 family ATP-binding protein [Novosphingobium marinum]NYH95110.1 ATP-binding protein involved in chromosome partitioning [Novosphingobium marinum]GGC24387.1 iron-sulfur cluster carrier protein [Novosphingobium marinum]